MSKRHHALSNESVRASTVVSSWADVDGAIPESKMIAMFKDKSSRTRNNPQPVYDVDDSDIEIS